MRRILLPLVLLLCAAPPLTAQTATVVNSVETINKQAGEAQSTIVPPHKKKQCLNGRILISNDTTFGGKLLPEKGVVLGRDLDSFDSSTNAPKGSPQLIEATFQQAPGADNYWYTTGDHDLLTLSNGDVLLLAGAGSKKPLKPKPAWFDYAYRINDKVGQFGPGAHGVKLIWRSTDCGETFQFLSEFDPAVPAANATSKYPVAYDGFCAYPQFRTFKDKDQKTQKILEKPYDMGGTDGPLVIVNPDNDHLFMTFRCVGYYPKTTYPTFALDDKKPLNKLLLVASYDGGRHWEVVGISHKPDWRLGIVPLKDQRLVFGYSTGLIFAEKSKTGEYNFLEAYPLAPSDEWGWDNDDPTKDKVYVNIWDHTMIARSSDFKSLVLAFPDTIAGQGRGYRLFFYNLVTGLKTEVNPITPASHNPEDFIMHPTAIDLGIGPILIYWYDFDSKAGMATIRGRFITTAEHPLEDFDISLSDGKTRMFDFNAPSKSYWYGDYHTAKGYRQSIKKDSSGKPATNYFYYPIWVEPDMTIRYTRVAFMHFLKPSSQPNPKLKSFALKPATISKTQSKQRVTPVPVEQLRLSPKEAIQIEEYSTRSREH